MASKAASEPKTPHAVILVPGIAGSELKDQHTGDLVWGLRPRLLEKLLIRGSIFNDLRSDRLEVGGLLQMRCFLPGFGRFDPYTKLAKTLQEQVCADPDAFAAYPYDWRRPVNETGAELAVFAARHLEKWRRHKNGSVEAGVCFVAHSMGGLLTRHAVHADVGLDRSDVSLILTLGTPFGGAVRAVQAIGHGDVLPIPGRAKQVREFLRETPAIYNLLPSYPCLTKDPTAPGATRPSPDTFAEVGGRVELAQQADEARRMLENAVASREEPPMVSLMGSDQPTWQSFTVSDGELLLHRHVNGYNWLGDGTVYTGAAYRRGHDPAHALPQKHGQIAKSPEGVGWVKAAIQHRTVGVPMGTGLGLDMPDTALAGEVIEIVVTGESCASASVTITNTYGRVLPRPRLNPGVNSQTRVAEMILSQPGLYEVVVSGGGFSPVVSDILVFDPSAI